MMGLGGADERIDERANRGTYEGLQPVLDDYHDDGSKKLIQPLDYRDADGETLLHVAAVRGDRRAVEWLLNAGADVNALGDMSLTPAHEAASQQQKQIFDLLVQRGADLTIVDEFGNTPPETWAFFEEEAVRKA
jgi:ankyrin repeat protein